MRDGSVSRRSAGSASAAADMLPAVPTQKATLKPYLEEIRQWVEQGRTDIWIAHTLNSTPASISAFRSQHGILRRDAAEGRGASVPPPVIPPDAPPEEPATKTRRRRSKKATGYEAVLDHGDEGYGFWLDGAVRDDPVFAEHWSGRRALLVRVDADQIVIRPDDRE